MLSATFNNISVISWRKPEDPEKTTDLSQVTDKLYLRLPLVEQEVFTLLEHLSSPPVFSGVRVTLFLVLCNVL
jgi:hypothetical protein